MAAVDVQWPSEDEDFDTKTVLPSDEEFEKHYMNESVGASKAILVSDTTEHDDSDFELETPPVSPPPEKQLEQAPVPVTAIKVTNKNDTNSEPDVEKATAETPPESEVTKSGALHSDSESPAAVAIQSIDADAKNTHQSPEKHAEIVDTTPITTYANPIESSGHSVEDSPKPTKKIRSSIIRTVVELLLLAALIGSGIWGYNLHSKNKALLQQVTSLSSNPAIVEQRKTADLVSKVSTLIAVPTGENPQAALVSDAVALKKQYPFFTTTQNGDEVLFYFTSGKVFVYRPSTNTIVQSGPLTVSAKAPTVTAKP